MNTFALSGVLAMSGQPEIVVLSTCGHCTTCSSSFSFLASSWPSSQDSLQSEATIPRPLLSSGPRPPAPGTAPCPPSPGRCTCPPLTAGRTPSLPVIMTAVTSSPPLAGSNGGRTCTQDVATPQQSPARVSCWWVEQAFS